MNKPQVTVTATLDGPRITGWEEFDRWARLNVVEWNRITEASWYLHLNETDRLKMLSSYLAHVLEQTRKNFVEHLTMNPVPPYVRTEG